MAAAGVKRAWCVCPLNSIPIELSVYQSAYLSVYQETCGSPGSSRRDARSLLSVVSTLETTLGQMAPRQSGHPHRMLPESGGIPGCVHFWGVPFARMLSLGWERNLWIPWQQLASSEVSRLSPVLGFRHECSGFRLHTSGFRLQALGFRLQASGFRVLALGFRLWGSGHLSGAARREGAVCEVH